jgi:hypothetical protein
VVKKVDGAIYKGILEPLIVEVVNEVFKKQRLDTESVQLVTRRRRRRKFQLLFHGSHSVSKSTCIFVMTIASFFCYNLKMFLLY